jgi:hypothetical protein
MQPQGAPRSPRQQEGVWNPHVVDLLTYNQKDNEFVFHILEPREWTDLSTQLAQLQAKIRSYLSYVLDGALAEDYPDSLSSGVAFRLDCSHRPSKRATNFVTQTAVKLDKLGIRFVVKVLDAKP